MALLRILLFIPALLFGFGTWVRNKFYDWRLLPSREFDFPVIGIGNLTMGGSGKTPHTEYLVRMLRERYKVATLSRGYGRGTSGFRLAGPASTSYDIGDEPKQYRKKFPDITVAVDESRAHGIKKIRQEYPDTDIVLLDDAFQHRAVKPGLNILLTDYGKPFYEDRIFPLGRLRESKRGMTRADIIIVTKTPDNFTSLERRLITKNIKALPHQHLYFSYIRYGEPAHFTGKKDAPRITMDVLSSGYSAVLLTGIANPVPLERYLQKHVRQIVPLAFRDHHEYALVDMYRLKDAFEKLSGPNKVIITTEKDAMRLEKPGMLELIGELPIYYIPIEIAFRDSDEEELRRQINDFLRSKITIKKN
ncbi:MAG: tetraacyldisaccharide 4'-kinase [Bacteroidota bacterium]